MLIALSGFSGKMGESIKEVAGNSYQIVDFKSADLQKNKPDVIDDIRFIFLQISWFKINYLIGIASYFFYALTHFSGEAA